MIELMGKLEELIDEALNYSSEIFERFKDKAIERLEEFNEEY